MRTFPDTQGQLCDIHLSVVQRYLVSHQRATDTLSGGLWDKVMSDSCLLVVQQSDINGRLQTRSDVPRSRRLVAGSIMRVMMY